jgi:hypothetical protein
MILAAIIENEAEPFQRRTHTSSKIAIFESNQGRRDKNFYWVFAQRQGEFVC